MKTLNFELKKLCKRNRDGSRARQANRQKRLNHIANLLDGMGFRKMGAKSLRKKHVSALVDRFKQDGLSPGTIKNYMSDLRWWAEKIGKPGVVGKSNDAYGIERRVYVTNTDKSASLSDGDLSKITCPYIEMSLRLQSVFGLRPEESMKIEPVKADRGNSLHLDGPWCKGGRPRVVPIRTAEQRRVLEEAKHLVGDGSLIPPYMDKYSRHLNRWEYQTKKAGLSATHGLRHRYAHNRYAEITGWPCPSKGGPSTKELDEHSLLADRAARDIVSRELGHSREEVTRIYLGR